MWCDVTYVGLAAKLGAMVMWGPFMITQFFRLCVLLVGSLLNQHTFLLGLLLLLSLQAGQADAADAVGASLEPGAAGHESAGLGALPAGLRCRNLQVYTVSLWTGRRWALSVCSM